MRVSKNILKHGNEILGEVIGFDIIHMREGKRYIYYPLPPIFKKEKIQIELKTSFLKWDKLIEWEKINKEVTFTFQGFTKKALKFKGKILHILSTTVSIAPDDKVYSCIFEICPFQWIKRSLK